ncbi:MAG: tetratricopeptide repeat protein [Fibrobacteres bacterium]|nr:tetratricopeptide repeat protein [Fibrobacterota bacterium]
MPVRPSIALAKGLALAGILGCLPCGLTGCDGRKPLRETPLTESQRKVSLADFRPPEPLEQIAEWYPGDWRLHLFLGLTDTSRQVRIAELIRADSLRPGEPMIAFRLCLAYLEAADVTTSDDSAVEAAGTAAGDSAGDLQRARPWLDKALARDPGNGALRVIEAYLLLREGRVPQARAIFQDPRRLPRGDFYYPRLEEALLGLFSDCRQWNPYTLTEAVALYRRVPFPPFEKLIDILYSVFLSTQGEHPYDIRLRGRDAALGLFRLGRNLRVDSYTGPKVLSGGYEQRSLGYMFQLKAAEFLTLYYRTFEDSAGANAAFAGLTDAQKEYDAFLASRPWEDSATTRYLDSWSALIRDRPGLKLPQALDSARQWTLWKRAMAARVPRRDSP